MTDFLIHLFDTLVVLSLIKCRPMHMLYICNTDNLAMSCRYPWETQINLKFNITLFSREAYTWFCENIVYILIDLFNAILGRWPFVTVPFNREGNKGMWKYSDCNVFTQLISNDRWFSWHNQLYLTLHLDLPGPSLFLKCDL